MIELLNTQVQTVAVNANVLYNTEKIKSGCAERYRAGGSQITLTGAGRYLVTFSGNISIPDGVTPIGEISLGITQQGEVLQGTEMRVTPAADSQYFNVSTQTYVDVYCSCTGGTCCQTIAVENTSATSINVDSPNFTAVRVNGR